MKYYLSNGVLVESQDDQCRCSKDQCSLHLLTERMFLQIVHATMHNILIQAQPAVLLY